MASASNAVGSSNNPRSFGSIMRRMNRNREARLPEWCACESRPVMRWSGTDSNPGRPFLGFPNYNTVGKKWCRLFLWVDKVLEEDVIACDDRTRHSVDDEEWKMKIAWKFGLGTNFMKFASLVAVPCVAPCIGLGGEFLDI
ncbi:Zinc finger GRF-type protein [Arachis hypogaea]|nr:Zinc finger GRF-type protein [Arachis hypogaea]